MGIVRFSNGLKGEIAELYRLESTSPEDVMVKWKNSVLNSIQYQTCKKRKYDFVVKDIFYDRGLKLREVQWNDTCESVEYIEKYYKRDATVMKQLTRLQRNRPNHGYDLFAM